MINIAIDGPAGAGKSTLARAAAARLGYIYADTGAMYRAVGYYVSSHGADCRNKNEVIPLLGDINIAIRIIDGTQRVYVNGGDVSDLIRTPEASMNASLVSPIPEVRSFLLDIQRNLAEENNIIMDGRDIGTVILPNAQAKIFLTASDTVRAKRRFDELKEKGQSPVYEDILEGIRQRDKNDSERETAPLKAADDAVILDTSELTEEQSLEKLIEIIEKAVK